MCESAPKAPTAARGYPRLRLGRAGMRRGQCCLGELRPFDHVPELFVRHLPTARAKTAVRADVDSLGIAEHLHGVENPVPDELGRLDEVRVDVEDAEPEDRLVGQIPELRDHLVAGTVGARCSELAAVVVREADAELPAAVHLLDRREEKVVVREAEMGREEAVEPLDTLVEALDEDVELVGLGRGARLVDLDPLRPELDQGLEIRADDVARQVVGERPARAELLVAAVSGADASGLRPVVLVVGPDRERVGACDRNLEVVIRDRLEKLELVVVVWLPQRGLFHDGGLRVVLVVEAAHGPARLESVGVVDRPCVHLGPLLLAVVDDFDAGTLEQPQRIAARPVPQLRLVRLAPLKRVDELLVAGDADLLAPAARVLDIALVERSAGRCFDEPRRLCERPDLVRQELHAAASTLAVFALPRRSSFSRAIGSETNWRSPFGTSASCSTSRSFCRRSANCASSRGSSSVELRASITPASTSLSTPLGKSVRWVA